jgi:hypothetical protein
VRVLRGEEVKFVSSGVKYYNGSAKSKDTRRRNSLLFFLDQWERSDTWLAQEQAMKSVHAIAALSCISQKSDTFILC